MELRTKRPSSSKPFAMEPPVSPAAPTNKTWVFDMLAGRSMDSKVAECIFTNGVERGLNIKGERKKCKK